MPSLKVLIPWVIATIMLMSALWSWYHPRIEYAPDGTYQRITETKWRTKQVKITTPDCTVEATDETIEGNPVTATAELETDDADYEIATTITPSTGKTEIFIQPQKPGLFDFKDEKELGFRYGMNEMEIYGRWTFLRIGAFYLAGYGEASTDNHSSLMMELSYRW